MASTETVDLFDRARAGSADALDALYRRSAAKLLPLIRLRLGRSLRSELESRDVLQTVLLKSFQKLGQVQNGASLMAWLARIAENEIRDQADFASRQRRDAALRLPIEDAADVPAPVRQALSQVIMNEGAERVERALETLSEPQREVIILRTLEELTFPEVAARLGKSTDACRMLFARAMAALTLAMPRTEA